MSNFWKTLIVLLMLSGLAGALTRPTQAQISPAPVVVKSDETGLVLSWTPPAHRVTTVVHNGRTYTQVVAPGLTPSGQPGHPVLPGFSKMVGLPASGEASVRIVSLDTEIVSLPYAPLPMPIPLPLHLAPHDLDPNSQVKGGPTVRLPDPAIYSLNAFYPAQVVSLGRPQQLRNQRLAALRISPLRVNPVTLELEVVRHVQIEISFTEPAAIVAQQSGRAPDGFSQALSVGLLNPEAAQWKVPHAVTDQTKAQAAGTAETKVLVEAEGLYAVTYGELQAAGVPVGSLDPRTLKLSHGYPRQEVAIVVEGEGDGSFDAGDRLLFYAAPAFSRFVDYDVYFLTYDGANGLRMSSRSGAPSGAAATAWRTTTAETNQFYDPLYAGRDGDYWYWAKLATPNSTSGSYGLPVENLQSAGPTATLTLWLQGYTANSVQNPDHKVDVTVNGNPIGTVTWDGKSAYAATLPVATSILISGVNQVRLSLPGIPGVFAEGMWLDAMQLRYPTVQAPGGQLKFTGQAGQNQYTTSGWSGLVQAYDVSNPATPQTVTGFGLSGGTLTIGDVDSETATYLVVPTGQVKSPLSLSTGQTVVDPAAGADYIIITPPSLSGAVDPLAGYRAGQGLRVAKVDVDAIYDAYGDGRLNPESIKRFLAHAYQNWSAPAPLYVLLVGDGSYDFKNYSGFNPQTLLPPYLAEADPWWGETAADNRLVAIVGGDTLPDMLIGRLAVNSTAETTTVVNKIIQYETNPPPGTWRGTTLFVSDDPDEAGNFHADADEAFTSLAGSLSGQRFYLAEQAGSQSHIYDNTSSLRSNFFAAFNSGAGLLTYHGHSSWHQWASEPLLHLNDVGQFNNQGRLPVVVQMTCFTGFFHHPEYATLDESLVRHSNGGAIASWAGTGLGVSTGHVKLQEGFYEAVMQQGETILGAATLAGKMELNAAGYYQDLLDTFTLFGDPALRMSAVFQPDLTVSQTLVTPDPEPGDTVTFSITIKNSGIGPASNVSVSSILPNSIMSPGWSSATAGVTALPDQTFAWTLPDIPTGASLTITITGTIDPALSPGFAISNVVSVSSGVTEMSTANNQSTLIIGGSRQYLPLILGK